MWIVRLPALRNGYLATTCVSASPAFRSASFLSKTSWAWHVPARATPAKRLKNASALGDVADINLAIVSRQLLVFQREAFFDGRRRSVPDERNRGAAKPAARQSRAEDSVLLAREDDQSV